MLGGSKERRAPPGQRTGRFERHLKGSVELRAAGARAQSGNAWAGQRARHPLWLVCQGHAGGPVPRWALRKIP